jgi:hypothetical protein
MYKGDLGLTKDKAGNYDLVLEDAGESLLRRTVITPPSWIRTWVIEDNQIILLDDSYGDGIYSQLSDPLTYEWLSKAKANINRALSFLEEDNITITNTSITMASSNGVAIDTADINISYVFEGVTRNYSDSIRL